MSSTADARELWRQARTVEDLFELIARLIEREIDFSPTTGADRLDSESEPLINHLAALNRAGFLRSTLSLLWIMDIVSRGHMWMAEVAQD